MKNHACVFLNRIAATYKGNPLKASPLMVLQEFFNYAQPAEHAKAFNEFCRAALKEKYSWQRGSAANALHYSEQLELLLEAAYLLYIKPHKHAACLKEPGFLLMLEGYANPTHFLNDFFDRASLKKWKTRLHAFTHAAIGKSSVADEMSGVAIHVFISSIKQLLYWMLLLWQKKSNTKY